MRRAAGLVLVLALVAACGDGQPGPPPGPALAAPAGRSAHVTTELVYEAAPDAPHRLVTTYQGTDRSRWSLKRLADADGDRRIEYRAGDRAFLLPQDTQTSTEYAGVERDRVLRRMELRRVALLGELDPPAWDAAGTLELSAGLGRIRRVEGAEGALELTAEDAEGRPEETLRLTAFADLGPGRRPAALELWFGGTRVWRETVTDFQLESWFKERYFWPPDRADQVDEP